MKDDELRQRIENADTIAALDKLRMDIVSSKDRTLLKLWQDKFWERKKKYSFEELRQYGIQERIDENNMWYYKIQNAPLSSPPYIESKEFYERNAELTAPKDKRSP